MKTLVSTTNGKGFAKIVLEVDDSGVDCLAFERADSGFPERDYFEQDLAAAQSICLELWAVPLDSWWETETIR